MPVPFVLIVDDEALLQWALVQCIESVGYRGEGANTGEEALERCTAELVDIVLLDRRLPDVDGLSIVGRLCATGSTVVMMSGMDEPGLHRAASAAGAYRVLMKPLELEPVLAVVREILQVRTGATEV